MKILRIVSLYLIISVLVITVGCESKQETGNSKPDRTGQTDSSKGIKVTFVELGSDRCIPCKKMQPIIEEIKKEYAGQVEVIFHDVWTNEGKPYAAKYKIRLIPTQVFLDREGKEYFRHEGFFPKDELVKILKLKGVN